MPGSSPTGTRRGLHPSGAFGEHRGGVTNGTPARAMSSLRIISAARGPPSCRVGRFGPALTDAVTWPGRAVVTVSYEQWPPCGGVHERRV